jgi:hypothetical protein
VNRRLRWVPAKISLGQGASLSPVAEPGVSMNRGTIEKIVYGGLILAGVTLLLTLTLGGSSTPRYE